MTVIACVGTGTPEIDFAVLSPMLQIAPSALTANRGGYAINHDVHLLGYPYNYMTDRLWRPTLALPLAKRAVVSGIVATTVRPGLIVLNGFNSPGFSGGPVLAGTGAPGVSTVIGIVSGYRTDTLPVDGDDSLSVAVNTGMIFAVPMIQVLDAIDIAPSGPLMDAGWDWPDSPHFSADRT